MSGNNPEMGTSNRCRRDVLRAIGASSIAVPAISGNVLAKQKQREVERLTGSERSKIVNMAINSQESELILDEVNKDGWYPVKSEADVLRAKELNSSTETVLTVVVPLEVKSDHESQPSRTFIWTTLDGLEHNSVIQEVSSSGRVFRRIFSEDNKTVVTTESLSTAEGSTTNVTVSPEDNLQWPGGGTGCLYVYEGCNDPNWTCLAAITLVYGACGSLVVSRSFKPVVECLAAAGVYVMQAMDEEGCSTCDDTDIRSFDVCGPGWQVMPP